MIMYKMFSVKKTVLLFTVSALIFSGSTGKRLNNENHEKEIITENFDHGEKTCDEGTCKGETCNCCPGFGIIKGNEFTDDKCEKCDCGGNFNCTFTEESFQEYVHICICPSGYKEYKGKCKKTCEDNEACKNGGKCEKVGSLDICVCPKGTEGPFCETVPSCDVTDCGSEASCVYEPTAEKGQCKCKDPSLSFEPDDLKCKKTCEDNEACKNGGKCEKIGSLDICVCPKGTKGPFCETVPSCDVTDCGSEASCVYEPTAEKGQCKCKDPSQSFEPDDLKCKKTCEDNEACKNGGKCEKVGSLDICVCPKGTEGPFCETVPSCDVTDCGSEASCVYEPTAEKGQCKCKDPSLSFEPDDLKCKSDCDNFDCNYVGKCEIEYGKPLCRCPQGYSGDRCEKTQCNVTTQNCDNGGTCEKSGEIYICSCKDGTSGDFCETVDECAKNSFFCGDAFSGAKCGFDKEKEKAFCNCTDASLKFDEDNRMCKGTCDVSNDACKNGGKCELRGEYAFCKCKNGTSGDYCDKIQACDTLDCAEAASCNYDEETEKAFCKCIKKNEAYNIREKKCEKFDGCILKIIHGNCSKPNEVCRYGRCMCKENYKYSENAQYCEEDKCASCPEGSVCDVNSDEICKCINGYFDGIKCVNYAMCEVGQSQCSQTCNRTTGECGCVEGFELSKEDNVACEITEDNLLCDWHCDPGFCIKINGEPRCVCPEVTHVPEAKGCFDKCSISNGVPPEGMNCPGKCERHSAHGIRCKCEDPYEQAEDGIHCRRKKMCEEENVVEECDKKCALCREPIVGKGYQCYCDRGFKVDNNGICRGKCEFLEPECVKKNAICELNERYEAECRCPPLLVKNEDGSCNKIASASYKGELSFLKSRYVTEDENKRGKKCTTDKINTVMLKKELKDSFKYVYGNNFEDVKILNCYVDEDLLKCKVELQLQNKQEPDKVSSALISPSYCYSIDEDYCLIKNLVVKREKRANIFQQTDPCIVKDIFCHKKSTHCKESQGAFQCLCNDGYRMISSFNPVGQQGNVVQICTDIDECQTNTDSCPVNTTCKNTEGGYDCQCNDGFIPRNGTLDPKKHGCEAICEPNPCANDGECVQTTNYGFVCRCKSSYTGLTCDEAVHDKLFKDVYECLYLFVGLIGTLIVLILIVIILIYKKFCKARRNSKRRQGGVSGKLIRAYTTHIKENEYSETSFQTNCRNHRLANSKQRTSNELTDDIVIPRVQIRRNVNENQNQPNVRSDSKLTCDNCGMYSENGQTKKSTMLYRNSAFCMEE